MITTLKRTLRPLLTAGGVLIAALSSGVHASTLEVDYTNTYQKMEGFGSSSIGWDGNMDTFYASASFFNLYLTEAGMSMYRMPIWPEVLSNTVANADDIKYQNFNTNNSRANSYITLVRNLHSRKADIRIIMSSWSPPGWMKTNGAIAGGGSLLPSRYQHFAKYLVEWCKFWKNEGINVYAMSVQNELLFVEPYESCVWTPEEYVNFHKVLGPMMEAAGFGDVLIFGPEHMTGNVTDTMTFVDAIQADPAAKPYFDIVATHGYTDGIQADTNPAAASALWTRIGPMGYKFWMTETSGEPATFDGALDGVAGSMHNAIVGGNCSAYVYWQTFEGSPSGFCLRGNNTNNPKFDAFRHYSKYIRPDMFRIGSKLQTGVKKVDVSAYADENTRKVTVVMLNRNDSDQVIDLSFKHNPGLTSMEVYRTTASLSFAKQTNLSISEAQTGKITLPPRSLTTLTGTAAAIDFPVNTIDIGNMEVPAGSGDVTIAVTSSLDFATWRAVSNATWLTFPSDTGTGTSTIKLSWKRNSNINAARVGNVDIAGKTISITQAGNPGLTLVGWKTTASKAGGSGSVTIESLGSAAATMAWTATSDADWVTIGPPSGVGKGTVAYTVAKNTTELSRTAHLTIADQPYIITQEAGTNNGTIFPAGGDSGFLENLGYYYDGFYPFVWLWGEGQWIWVAPTGASLADGFYFWQFGPNRWGWTKQAYLPYYYPFIGDNFGDPVPFTTGL
ncbi:MAG: BACON domain-containing carbohydrate-binding protein [Verrucomicrobiota bacterium]|nr:BACON domain-containing carbohydrate-binding protein [Verrucomicrobiota bacterium]